MTGYQKMPYLTRSAEIKQKGRGLQVFIFAFIIGLCLLLPYVILDQGAFMFYGDFDVQQIPFYMQAHRAIRSGDLFWSWTTDLGANFIGSYSFYLLGSPFFWLTLPLPEAVVPYTISWLLVLKFACAALTAYLFLKRFVRKNEFAMIGGLLYAFSGFAVYNIFFNHFHEPLVFFPLLLLGLEKYMVEGKKGCFALAVAINALVNYFFFFGEVVFVVIYWFLRCMSDQWQVSFKKLLIVALEAVTGLCLAMFLLAPSLFVVFGNPRTGNFLNNWNMFFYGWEQRYGYIFQSFFFPPEIPARPNFFPNAEAKWSSVAGWLPLFSMAGVIAYLQSKKNDWLKRIIYISMLMAFIPLLNSMFSAFNEAYYARWFYMPILMMVLATVKGFESRTINWNRGIKWAAIITGAFSVGIGLGPKLVPKEGTTDVMEWAFGLMNNKPLFWLYVAIAAVSLVICYILIKKIKPSSPHFTSLTVICLAVIITIYGNVFISTGRANGYNKTWMKENLIDGYGTIDLDTRNCRVDVYEGMDNIPMFWNMPTIQAFHSIVPNSVMSFYPKVGVERGVGSRPEMKHEGLRPLLSVRWLIDPDNDSGDFIDDYSGWKYIGAQRGFGIYENTNYIPYGFCYDQYMTEKTFDDVPEGSRDRMLLKAILFNEEQIAKYGHLYTELQTTEWPEFSAEELASDSAARRETAADYFERDNHGFDAKINAEKETLVFFSVPWEEGWSAQVNGKEAEIEKINVGFMAVKVDAGENIIRFNYRTPWLAEGFLITGITAVIFICYLLLHLLLRKNRKIPVISSYKNLTPYENTEINPENTTQLVELEELDMETDGPDRNNTDFSQQE